MLNPSRILPTILAAMIGIGTLAGLHAAHKRWVVEVDNRRVEIGLEWPEVLSLAQTNPLHISLDKILGKFKSQDVSSLIIGEDTLGGLEQNGYVTAKRGADGASATVEAIDDATLERIRGAAAARGWVTLAQPSDRVPGTLFTVKGNIPAPGHGDLFIPMDWSALRSMGVGLPLDALDAAVRNHLRVTARIGNFAGIDPVSAAHVLKRMHDQGASVIIFSGDETLGFRGQERSVASVLGAPWIPEKRSADSITPPTEPPPFTVPVLYGAVEFGKQKGDETLAAALKGDYVRVHSIQIAEMGQLEEAEAIHRFILAARERNIRYCFVRLFTFAGADPVETNVQYVRAIVRGMQKGSASIGGTLVFGAAHPFNETYVSKLDFALIGLGVAGGTLWMLRALVPLPRPMQTGGLVIVGMICVGLSVMPGDTGRKLVALLAGIVFPAVACLRTFPSVRGDEGPVSRGACITGAARGLAFASAITALGIVHVVGLLATRPFIVKADQFVGIKAKHAIPVLIIALVAAIGGPAGVSETWSCFRARVNGKLLELWNEPIRFGILVLGIVAIAALALVVARTGNDSGVGVSGFEMKFRAVLDRALPVRPRTKEFLVGHPAFVLALAWWLRGRRKLAIPAFVVGSLGQVSILNTFCHIHTPLAASIWRDLIGLVFGAILGIGLFVISELLLPMRAEAVTIDSRAAGRLRMTGADE